MQQPPFQHHSGAAVAQLVGTTGDGRGVANTRFEVPAGTKWTRLEGPESLKAWRYRGEAGQNRWYYRSTRMLNMGCLWRVCVRGETFQPSYLAKPLGRNPRGTHTVRGIPWGANAEVTSARGNRKTRNCLEIT